jgi:hypothetical protein
MRRTPLPLVLMLACATCGQAPPADPARRATVPGPAAAPTPASPAESSPAESRPATRYACDGGAGVEVAYGRDEARVTLPDGRLVTLPKAQSASKGGGEVFVGEAVSLQRDGDAIQLFQDEGGALRCRASAPTE